MCAPSPPPAPDYAGAAQAQGAANVDAARTTLRGSNPNIYSPYGNQTVTWGDNDQATVRQTLTPEQQAIFDTNQTSQQQLADLGLSATNRASGILGQDVDFSGAPSVHQVDTSGLSSLGSGEATRAKVLAAMMGRADEDYAKQSDQARSDLIARGIPVGSKAFADNQQMIERSHNDARSQAELTATSAANQQFGQDLSARQQGLTEQQAQQQGSTSARQQAITELLAQRQTPLNEINAFRSGSQVSPLSFQNYSGTTVAPAPVYGAAQATGQANQNTYNQQVAGSNAMTSGLFQIGAAAVPYALSDRRLKSNIKRIGTHDLGIGIYEYDIFGEHERGVMADEVEGVLPQAVAMHPSGFKMVNYDMIGGRP